MEKKNRLIWLCGAMLLMLASCSQDELTEQSGKLPEGAYPVEIGSVTVTGVSSETQTRMTENSDGSGSIWTDGDVIGVQMSGTLSSGSTVSSEGQYSIFVSPLDNSVSAITAVSGSSAYWQTSGTGTVTAWYPADDTGIMTVNLSDQSNGLAYVLQGMGTGSYGSAVSLNFTHQLSKIRVALTGDQASDVTGVQLYTYTSCTNTQGTVSIGSRNTQGWITMMPVKDSDGSTKYYEANVVPGYAITKVRINSSHEGKIASITPEAAKLYSVTVEAYTKVPEIDLSTLSAPYVISDNKNYYFKGSGSHPIQVSGSGISPTIYLNGVSMTVSENNAIDIQGTANVSIVVSGSSNTITSTTGAGIFVAEGSTVNISADGKDNVLKVTGSEGRSGIGGYCDNSYKSVDCGNINISNITLYATSLDDSENGVVSPGIGGTGTASCQSITIDNATIYAYASSGAYFYAAPAIGNGEYYETLPTIKISNSTVYAYRGEENEDGSGNPNDADYIGWPDETDTDNSPANSSISVGTGGSVTSSTIYCYTGADATSVDKTVTYDASGNATTE